ncbi:uncharacterized protein LDX57_002907 [Aspergillus melleus]|uniref:uncharacterized protein n=1 Tax=Aspergillus melleus TaxID=138277 RepID=UPI001E8D2FFB|nr:uncharacterized protein LDX57_002907 [Aspergillus melleus]KAH8425158.1 hypothetical protein LDX57_002907 [Aspergillus melleus]
MKKKPCDWRANRNKYFAKDLTLKQLDNGKLVKALKGSKCVKTFYVAATLAAVEDYNPTTYLPFDKRDSNLASENHNPNVKTTLKIKPITSGLRSTIKYLRARDGSRWYLRGYCMYLAFIWLELGIGIFVPRIIPTPVRTHSLLSAILGGFVTSMLLATWQMAWEHNVIAQKPPKWNYRRMLGLRNWRRIAPAAALYNLIICGAFYPLGSYLQPFGFSFGLTVVGVVTNPQPNDLFSFLVPVRPVDMIIPLISIPARAIFIRVAASMLPEENDSIVPFDRQFGGNVRPHKLDGSSKLGIKDAWTTFEWDAMIHYTKVALTAIAIDLALAIVGLLLVFGEMMLLMPTSKSPISRSLKLRSASRTSLLPISY